MANQNDETGNTPETEIIEEEEEEESLSVVEKFIGVFAYPVKTFTYLAQKPDFISALIIISLISIGLNMISLPKTMPLYEKQTIALLDKQMSAQSIPDNEKTKAMESALPMLRITYYVGKTLGVPIGLLIVWLLTSVLIFFIALGQGLDTDFKRLMGIIPWLSVVTLIQLIISIVIYHTADLSNVELEQDPYLLKPYSLLAFFPKSLGLPMMLQTLISSIDPFLIWSFILTVIALMKANRCTKTQAIITTAIATIIGILVISGISGMSDIVQVRAGA